MWSERCRPCNSSEGRLQGDSHRGLTRRDETAPPGQWPLAVAQASHGAGQAGTDGDTTVCNGATASLKKRERENKVNTDHKWIST